MNSELHSEVVEVASGTLRTPDGDSLEMHGGVYLPPAVYLATHAELSKLREREESSVVPLIIGAALLGVGVGYWLGRKK